MPFDDDDAERLKRIEESIADLQQMARAAVESLDVIAQAITEGHAQTVADGFRNFARVAAESARRRPAVG